MEVSDRPVKRQKIHDGGDVSDATPDHSGLHEIILATRRDITAGPGSKTHKMVCLDEYPELSELMYASKLQHFSCKLIQNMANNLHRIRSRPLQDILKHVNCTIQLNKLMSDPTSKIGLIARQMSSYEKHVIEWQGLELYEVLTNLPTYEIGVELPTNLRKRLIMMESTPLDPKLSQKFQNIMKFYQNMSRLSEQYLPITPKGWHSGVIGDFVPIVSCSETATPTSDALELIERDSFGLIIEAQQLANPQTTASKLAHTAVVTASSHGGVSCGNFTGETLPMYVIPPNKTLTIVSVATPTCVAINSYSGIKKIITQITRVVSRLNFNNYFIDPLQLANMFKHEINLMKQANRGFGIKQKLKHIEPELVASFLQNYTDPRIVCFNTGDTCLNKKFTFNTASKTQLLKLNFDGWDQELMPPRLNVTDVNSGYHLSAMCDYLFKTESHTNIVLFDWTCSNVNVSASNVDLVREKALHYFYGGHT